MSHAAEASTDHCIWLHQYWCRLDKSDLWRMMEGTGERMESVEVNVDQRFEYFGSEVEGLGYGHLWRTFFSLYSSSIGTGPNPWR